MHMGAVEELGGTAGKQVEAVEAPEEAMEGTADLMGPVWGARLESELRELTEEMEGTGATVELEEPAGRAEMGGMRPAAQNIL